MSVFTVKRKDWSIPTGIFTISVNKNKKNN